ncbi:MAG: hypothetical protein Q8R37_02100, partial [Nanoarchaeota archaeon]|nr:hypothetical protein [Nanoarchaeota archaeon]
MKLVLIFLSFFLLSSLVSAGWTPPGLGSIYATPVHVINCDETSGSLCADSNTTRDVAGNASYGFDQSTLQIYPTDRNGSGRSRQVLGADLSTLLRNDTALVMKTNQGVMCFSMLLNGTPDNNGRFVTAGDRAGGGTDGKAFAIYFHNDGSLNQFSWLNYDENNNIGFKEDIPECIDASKMDKTWTSICLNWSSTASQFWVNNTLCDDETAINSGQYGPYFANAGESVTFGNYIDGNAGEAVNAVYDSIVFWNVQSTATNDIIGRYHRGDWVQSAGADTSPPVVALLSPANGITVLSNNNPLTFKASATDASVITQCDLYHNSSGLFIVEKSNTSIISGVEFSFSSAIARTHIGWNVQCTDTNLNSAFAASNFTVTVLDTPPALHNLQPPDNFHDRKNVSVNFTYTDFDNDIGQCSFFLNNSLQTTATNVASGSLVAFSTNLTSGDG